jgi:hypothetical protein
MIFVVICFAAAAEWKYPENGGHWDEMCKDQMHGSPIDLDYTYKNFYFHELARNNTLMLTGLDKSKTNNNFQGLWLTTLEFAHENRYF